MTPDANMTTSATKIPAYRKQWVTILMALAGFLFFWPLMVVAIIYVWTGPVYYTKKGEVRTYSVGLKVVTSVLLLGLLVGQRITNRTPEDAEHFTSSGAEANTPLVPPSATVPTMRRSVTPSTVANTANQKPIASEPVEASRPSKQSDTPSRPVVHGPQQFSELGLSFGIQLSEAESILTTLFAQQAVRVGMMGKNLYVIDGENNVLVSVYPDQEGRVNKIGTAFPIINYPSFEEAMEGLKTKYGMKDTGAQELQSADMVATFEFPTTVTFTKK